MPHGRPQHRRHITTIRFDQYKRERKSARNGANFFRNGARAARAAEL
jgi:hypothetical protein